MQFIADVWWIWGILLLISIVFVIGRMFGHVEKPSTMLSGNSSGLKGTFMTFIPAWVFGILFVLSLVLNVIDYAKT